VTQNWFFCTRGKENAHSPVVSLFFSLLGSLLSSASPERREGNIILCQHLLVLIALATRQCHHLPTLFIFLLLLAGEKETEKMIAAILLAFLRPQFG
jgi:hypothetical protein